MTFNHLIKLKKIQILKEKFLKVYGKETLVFLYIQLLETHSLEIW